MVVVDSGLGSGGRQIANIVLDELRISRCSGEVTRVRLYVSAENGRELRFLNGESKCSGKVDISKC